MTKNPPEVTAAYAIIKRWVARNKQTLHVEDEPVRSLDKVTRIFQRVIDLTSAGFDRNAAIKKITKEFELRAHSTAVTYFNDALRVERMKSH